LRVLFKSVLEAPLRRAWLEALQAAAPEVAWCQEAPPGASFDAAVLAGLPRGALAEVSGLRLVQSLWAGVDGLLADPTLPGNVPLARMVDPAMSAAMAETAVWATLALHRDFFGYGLQQQETRWQALPQRLAAEVPVLVLGMGAMGGRTASALAALGYPVTGWRLRPEGDAPAGVRVCAGEAALQEAISRASVVINLLPLTPATRGLVDRSFLARLPRQAALVNLARGAHVVDTDLLEALDAGHLSRAVLDVFATEPLPPGHPYWRHPRVTVLPHVAAITDPRTASRVAAENLRRLAAGEPLLHLVDRSRGY
jgi:glyoxylate/hydroxypyruvate reductase A